MTIDDKEKKHIQTKPKHAFLNLSLLRPTSVARGIAGMDARLIICWVWFGACGSIFEVMFLFSEKVKKMYSCMMVMVMVMGWVYSCIIV
jgi:hypothetical protein